MKKTIHKTGTRCANILGLLCGLALFATAQADSTLVYSGEEGLNRILLSPQGLRMEMSGKDGSQAIIYDGQRNAFIIIMPEKKKYMEMTQKDIEAIADMRNRMMQQMEQQLADVPPAQREQMRRMMSGMMKGKMGNATATPTTVRYVDTGETAKAMGHSCRIYEMRVNGGYESDVCVAPIKQLGVAENEYAHFSRMLDFMQKMAKSAGINNGSMMAGMPENAMPLWFEQDGQRRTLKSVSHQPLDKSLFLPPAGYQRATTGLEKLRH